MFLLYQGGVGHHIVIKEASRFQCWAKALIAQHQKKADGTFEKPFSSPKCETLRRCRSDCSAPRWPRMMGPFPGAPAGSVRRRRHCDRARVQAAGAVDSASRLCRSGNALKSTLERKRTDPVQATPGILPTRNRCAPTLGHAGAGVALTAPRPATRAVHWPRRRP
jgi:hypothetical protein